MAGDPSAAPCTYKGVGSSAMRLASTNEIFGTLVQVPPCFILAIKDTLRVVGSDLTNDSPKM